MVGQWKEVQIKTFSIMQIAHILPLSHTLSHAWVCVLYSTGGIYCTVILCLINIFYPKALPLPYSRLFEKVFKQSVLKT